MGRSYLSDELAITVNQKWIEWQTELPYHGVNVFIDFLGQSYEQFDVTYLNENGYACFHLHEYGRVFTVYYWKYRDEWFCKE